jgi:hypothetical protein
MAMSNHSIQRISVIVPKNPFAPLGLQQIQHCLTALNVEKLMEWWPGKPHTPRRDPSKVRSIQRSLDWKRVAKIAAYLLQKEIVDVPKLIDRHFRVIYEPRKLEPGREWPPKVQRVVGFQSSEYPTFSNVLLHVNGASVKPLGGSRLYEAATLLFDENDKALNFSVIDGQHRINGAFLALKILREENKEAIWEIPAEIFLDLDLPREAPRRQAQIFIDVNFNQKKVDKSLVADLFPTARSNREPLDDQTEFLALCLDAWLEATGRKQDMSETEILHPDNVAYQGRVLVSFLTLLPVCISKLRRVKCPLISTRSREILASVLQDVMRRAGLLERNKFLPKSKFQAKGFLGSGGVARFRDILWAAATTSGNVSRLKVQTIGEKAALGREKIWKEIPR